MLPHQSFIWVALPLLALAFNLFDTKSRRFKITALAFLVVVTCFYALDGLNEVHRELKICIGLLTDTKVLAQSDADAMVRDQVIPRIHAAEEEAAWTLFYLALSLILGLVFAIVPLDCLSRCRARIFERIRP